jgi:hypothetical protein
MDRFRRHVRLKELWRDTPIHENGCNYGAFLQWQGEVSALLGFNPKLQADFQGAVAAVDPNYNFATASPDEAKAQRRLCSLFATLIAQAIGELRIQEEPQIQKAHAPILTDEHGVLWFVTHCTWGTKWKMVALVASAAGAIFFAGFRLGAIERVRDWYIQWTDSLSPSKSSPSPTPLPTPPSR